MGVESREAGRRRRATRTGLALAALVGAIALVVSGCGGGDQPADAADPSAHGGALDWHGVNWAPFIVVVVLVGAVVTKGAFGKLAAVLVIAVVAWVSLAPDLAPELSTPDGPWKLSLTGSSEGSDLLLVNTQCATTGAEGTVVNLGDSRADLVLRTTYSPDQWENATVDLPLLRVPAHTERPWTVPNTLKGDQKPTVPCEAAIIAARRQGAQADTEN